MIKLSTMNTAAKNHFIVAIFFFVVLVIMLCSGGSAHGQVKKDTIPPKQFVFVMKPADYNYLDSVLMLSLTNTGYELNMRDGDALRTGLKNILLYFQRVATYQDSVYSAALKKPK